jgi:HK97 gp10 family phage protein
MVSAKVELKINEAMIRALFNDADKVINDSADSLAKEMKRRIKTGAKSGKQYGNHTASAPGQSPANWTGDLVNSILAINEGKKSRVVVNAKYAEFLELGTSKMRPRPFILPSIQKIKKQLAERLKRTR